MAPFCREQNVDRAAKPLLEYWIAENFERFLVGSQDRAESPARTVHSLFEGTPKPDTWGRISGDIGKQGLSKLKQAVESKRFCRSHPGRITRSRFRGHLRSRAKQYGLLLVDEKAGHTLLRRREQHQGFF